MMKVKDIDFRIIGIGLLVIGFCIYISGNRNDIITSVCMGVIMIGIIISIFGIIFMIKNQRQKDLMLEKDIEKVIQPLVTKYSKINKELIKTQTKEDMDTYIAQRKKINIEMEEELTKQLPYLSSTDIKKIIIEFNKQQESL